ncbi:MAG: response regulator transcription factor [Lachnospiraceae bacterium]|nr:response regulator transcription factor [Lachnospiraceae bacterium]
MLNIFLCDDEEAVYDSVRDILQRDWMAQGEKGIPYELTYFSSGEELLAHGADCDILFLDIEMPDMDGIETAGRLKKQGDDCIIIMLTGNTARFKEAFKIGALRYVTKPMEEEELLEALGDAKNRLVGKREIGIEEKGESFSVMEKDIIYLMADRNVTVLYTKGKDFRSQVPLKEWMERLDDRIFFPCHRSYLVNMAYAEHVQEKEVRLKTGERIPVSKRRYKEFLHRFISYETNYR